MNLSKIKETMDNIHMSEKTQKEIIENNGEFEKWHSELICKKREGGKEND